MMLRVDGEYLDFEGDIDVEAQIKLFEEIDSNQGDWSYSFELSKTNHNLKKLGLPFPDTVKSIFNSVQCDIINDSGFLIYSGSLRVEKISETISCSFFSGNNDWFNLLNEPMSSLPLYKYDYNITEANIMASWAYTKGMVFPLIDTGALVTRSFPSLKIEDFTGCLYVRELMRDVFNPHGIKLKGDLFDDDTYNRLIIATNGKSQSDVANRSSYIQKTTAQSAVFNALVSFQNETIYPFFDGSNNNYDTTLYRYTADVKMRVKIDVTLQVAATVGAPNISVFDLIFQVNGSTYRAFSYSVNSTGGPLSKSFDLPLEAGDYTDLRITVTALNGLNITSGSIKITPSYIYRAFGASSVPNWTQLEFVSNIFRLFNPLVSFDSSKRELTVDLFNKIRSKQEIDISDDIELIETDYSEFISSYGKRNIFKYRESDDEDLRIYNVNNFIKYGSGNIQVNNDFIDDSAEVVESDFTSPVTYLNGVFDASMERIHYVELDEITETSITSISNASGIPRFNITNADQTYAIGDLVRFDLVVDSYDGDWVINAVTSSYITVIGLGYSSSTTGTATLMRHKFTSDDNVYLFVNAAFVQNLFFSSNYSMVINSTPFTYTSLAYFNMLSNGREINTKYKQSLAFGQLNNPLSSQMTLLTTYWSIFYTIMNDPTMLRVAGYFNLTKFSELKTFLRPLRVKLNESSNQYYLNRITGYKDKSIPCEAELIKL